MIHFTWANFFLRLVFAIILVFITYNPTGYSYAHWLLQTLPSFTPLLGIASIVLVIGWIIYVRASIRSIGLLGFVLLSLFFAFLVWLFIDLGWLSLGNTSALSWIIESAVAVILAIGLSWSHVRRRLSGQVDTDDIDQ